MAKADKAEAGPQQDAKLLGNHDLPKFDTWILGLDGLAVNDTTLRRQFRQALSAYTTRLNSSTSKNSKAVKAHFADFIAQLDEHSTGQSSGSIQFLPAHAIDVLARAQAYPEEKASVDLLDVLVRHYPTARVIKAAPGLYRTLIRYHDGTDGSHARRIRLATSMIGKYAQSLGLETQQLRQMCKSELHALPAWKAWSSLWLEALAEEMLTCNEAGRAAISQHVQGLLVMVPAALMPLLRTLTGAGEAEVALSAKLRGSLCALVAARCAGLCIIAQRSSTHDDNALGAEQVDADSANAAVIMSIDPDFIEACARAPSPEIFLSALSFAVESRTNTSAPSAEEYGVIQTVLTATITSTDARIRQALLSSLVRLINRIIASGHASARDAARLRGLSPADATGTTAALLQRAESDIARHRAFINWSVSLMKQYLRPSAPYPSLIFSLHVLEVILGAGFDPSYNPPSSISRSKSSMAAKALQQHIIDGHLVQQLLASVNSTYFEVQDAALALLGCFPAPLPSLEAKADAEAAVLFRAVRAMNTARECDSAAAAGLLKLYDDIYVSRLGWQLAPLDHLLDRSSEPTEPVASQATFSRYSLHLEVLSFISSQLKIAQLTSQQQSGLRIPLHGGLLTAQKLLNAVQLGEKTPDFEIEEVFALFKRTEEIVREVWHHTAAILCSAAPEGNTEDDEGEDDAEMPSNSNVAPQVSTAYNLTHQAALSHSWRGMKEASSLLSALIVTSSRWGQTLFQKLWSPSALDSFGKLYLTWLQNIRHRGTFTTVYPAFSSLASTLVRQKNPDVAELPMRWLRSVITDIESRGANHSTTRRSAGWGFAVLALLSALPGERGERAIAEVVASLSNIATRSKDTHDAESVRQVHAMNVLQCIVLDAVLASRLLPYVDGLIRLSISHFSSSEWTHRNAGMMLFSACCHRGFSVRHKNKDAVTTRLPFHEFETSFPGLSQFLAQEMSQTVHDVHSSSTAPLLSTGSVFAAQIVLSRLQAGGDHPQHALTLRELAGLVEHSLADSNWKVRELAARAYRSLTPPQEAETAAMSLLSPCSTISQNDLHGRLLAIRLLLSERSDVSASEELWESLQEKLLTLFVENRCPSTRTAFLQVIQLVLNAQSPAAARLLQTAGDAVRQALDNLRNTDLRQHLSVPGLAPFLAACSDFAVSTSRTEGADLDKVICYLLEHPCHDVCWAILTSNQLSAALGRGSGSIRRILFQKVLSSEENLWHRVRAAELLSVGEISQHLIDEELSDDTVRTLLSLLSSHDSEPLVDALLLYSAILMSARQQDAIATDLIGQYCAFAIKQADAWKPADTRLAIAHSLRILARQIFSKEPERSEDVTLQQVFNARLCVLELLTDDDPSVRSEAELLSQAIVTQQASSATLSSLSVLDFLQQAAAREPQSCSTSLRDLWQYMADSSLIDKRLRVLWAEYVWKQIRPAKDLHFHDVVESAVFLVDVPNQFRDEEEQINIAYRHAPAAILVLFAAKPDELRLDLISISSVVKRIATGSTFSDRPLALRAILSLRLLRDQLEVTSTRSEPQKSIDEAIETVQRRFGFGYVSSEESVAPPSTLTSLTSSELAAAPARDMYRIAMVSDFFYPNVGGVEGHMYLTSLRLLARGHKVIVITHAYAPDRVGVRYLTGGVKIYYVPYGVIARQDTLPNFFGLQPLIRMILLRERIDIVHGHQALSSMAHEGILHARALGIKTVFTDHSLFGFADAASILTNKLLRFVLSDVDHVVCVSHTGKENTVLRAVIDPGKVSVIPNAVVSDHFRPREQPLDPQHITIVILSRLMYRKGIDLLIAAIPRLCAQHHDVRFLIGGDGPKRVELEQMRERHRLQDRVEMAGAIRQGDARAHLIRGQIFLNTSLTEAFGTSIVEAASAGLFVVSTRVGGIPEVLPDAMIRLADAEEDAIVSAVSSALTFVRSGAHDPSAQHKTVRDMYTWDDVAFRLEEVYSRARQAEVPSFIGRLQRYHRAGPIAGPIFCIVVTTAVMFLTVLEYFWPVHEIDIAAEFQTSLQEREQTPSRR